MHTYVRAAVLSGDTKSAAAWHCVKQRVSVTLNAVIKLNLDLLCIDFSIIVTVHLKQRVVPVCVFNQCYPAPCTAHILRTLLNNAIVYTTFFLHYDNNIYIYIYHNLAR